MQLTFYGGVGLVTGSNFLLEDDEPKPLRIMIDCGLIQGTADIELRNWEQFPYDPAGIDFLVVTHAHIDHIGRIPKLVREGFRGQIISTGATKALAEPMLMDSKALLEEFAHKHHRDILYDEKDIAEALSLWRGVFYHEPIALPNDLSLQFLPAGHILGSGMAELSRSGQKIIFTGDLGGHSDLLEPAESIVGVQYLVMESVYGDRTHDEQKKRLAELERVVTQTARRGGTLLIPAFSTERTQDLLFDVRTLLSEKRIPSMPVFLDSPLAIIATKIFTEHPKYFNPEIRQRLEAGEDIFYFSGLKLVEQVSESHAIERVPNPKIIIAGSGMSSGGRILAHEKALLPDKKATICMVGYQSAGSLGRKLLEGARTVELLESRVTVYAQIEHLFSYSAHMDSNELLQFAAQGAQTLKKVFIVMGEPAASGYLAQRLRDYASIDAYVPKAGEHANIEL